MRSREEQIADLTNLFGEEGTFSFVDDRDAATKHILEAERRAEQRARAECDKEISSLRKGLSKCADLTGGFASPDCSIPFLTISVPEELRLYINRLKEKVTQDSERLDWIERHRATQAVYLDGSGWHIVPDGESCGVGGETFRAAVDAAMKAEREAQG
ncbi:hypothetical protein B0W47_00505 [Komagataeibacter nataicola]|uniref:Uncharacterized protein n=1 Tax=Komagataeibacter nataicola TaxID=265960 RepID=A0A9N7CJ94_9PROT|nr:hypothetical protein [Komagataeibacter nataicola]AQU86183.1 hypothetical protein B0W47_00505 [Komagataeibacter nataicola]PYD65318.1 hypothetical protein CDI09_14010 [Komagataeibacter nataicola]GBR22974.1 hypothetical protein AA0616_2410 [Komagataeibacter nataicola NRIC 0616]